MDRHVNPVNARIWSHYQLGRRFTAGSPGSPPTPPPSRRHGQPTSRRPRSWSRCAPAGNKAATAKATWPRVAPRPGRDASLRRSETPSGSAVPSIPARTVPGGGGNPIALETNPSRPLLKNKSKKIYIHVNYITLLETLFSYL
jgi:hypothetical protein